MLASLLAICALAYVGFAWILWAVQDRMLFVGRAEGRGAAMPEHDGVRIDTIAVDGVGRIRIAIARPKAAPRSVMVFFGGNGEDLRSGIGWSRFWADEYSLLAIYAEHPGYGDSEGEPSSTSFARSAEAAAKRAEEFATGLPLFTGGNSLGSYCALHLASRGLAQGVILRSPPSSIAEIGARRFPFMPVRWLLRHDFDNLALAREVRVPVLVVHGDADTIVPLRDAQRLVEALGDHGELVIAVGCGHNDVPFWRRGPFGPRIDEFLSKS